MRAEFQLALVTYFASMDNKWPNVGHTFASSESTSAISMYSIAFCNSMNRSFEVSKIHAKSFFNEDDLDPISFRISPILSNLRKQFELKIKFSTKEALQLQIKSLTEHPNSA